jgi:hypothetical protein
MSGEPVSRMTLCPDCGRDRGNREPHRPGCPQATNTELWRQVRDQNLAWLIDGTKKFSGTQSLWVVRSALADKRDVPQRLLIDILMWAETRIGHLEGRFETLANSFEEFAESVREEMKGDG